MTFWESLFGTVIAVLVGVVLLSPVACTMHRHRLIADLIEKGHDPISTKCAIETDTGGHPMCTAKAAR